MLDIFTLENLQNTWIGKVTNSIRYFKGYSLQPFFITFIITYKCNLNCDFCYQKDYNKTKQLNFDVKDLQLINKNIDCFFKPRVHIFGGEPTIHPRFSDIVRFLEKNKYKLYMTTNGTRLNEFIDLLKNFKEINVSLNTDNWEENIEIADKLKRKSKARIYLMYTLNSTEKIKRINKIMKVMKNKKIDSLVLLHPINIFSKNSKPNIDFKLLTNINNPRVKFSPLIRKENIKDYYTDINFPKINKCLNPWFFCLILPNCDVIPCEQLKTNVVGNLKKTKMSEIWNGEKFRDFRKSIQRDGIWDFCVRCCIRQYY